MFVVPYLIIACGECQVVAVRCAVCPSVRTFFIKVAYGDEISMVGRFKHVKVGCAAAYGEVHSQAQVRNRGIFCSESVAYFECDVSVERVILSIIHRITYSHTGAGFVVARYGRLFKVLLNLSVAVGNSIVRVQQRIFIESTIRRCSVRFCVVYVSDVADEQSFITVAYIKTGALSVYACLFHHTGSVVYTCIQFVT